MTLNKYHQKRNFGSTAEPPGEIQKSERALIFVVQKHAATRLHYDFRLEMEGVLKSWAVPKGPSMNPEDKRLAMMVEDHPYEYKDFEGNIPEGNYGAGNVIVWDHGTYTSTDHTANQDPEDSLLAALKKGHLSIILKGEKLKGEFSLVKMTGKQENAWLLFKKSDSFATNKDILIKNKSVMSNITLESLEKKQKKSTSSETKKSISNDRQVELSGMPKLPAEFISPMLAEITTQTFDDQNWVFENKYDGYRTIAVINPDQVNLYSRNHLSFNKSFGSIVQELKKIEHIAVLDGEAVILNNTGHSDFQLLQNHLKSGGGTLTYFVFDILNLDGNDTRNLTLLERKELLKMLLAKYSFQNIFYSEHIIGKGKAYFEQAVKNQQEGIMAKKSDSPYRSGRRSSDWLKIKIVMTEEAIIAGITEPRGTRNFFGALLLARYEDGKLKFIGKCGTGFDEKTLKDLYSKFEPEFTNSSPFTDKINLPDKIQWLRPKYVCQVKFAEWTQDDHLRHPVYLGLRIDKRANEVSLTNDKNAIPMKTQTEKTQNKPSGNAVKYENDSDLKIGKINLHLTNQNKIYFPEDLISKGDLINYYTQVSEIILPYLKDRPQSLNRFPNGISGKNFYHKDMDIDKIPTWLKTYTTFSESNQSNIDYLLCNDLATLLYMANLGCIEINPWNSTIKNIEKPTWVVIDLDPEKIEFREVVKTALVVKEVLDNMGISCYCKTSGATGLHIYIPLASQYDYHTAKIFAELVANMVNEQLPDTTSIVRAVQQRQNRVYIDFLQNNIVQTLAAPYSVRPRPGATVSTPLDWDEVNDTLSPDQFTIKNIPDRIKEKGDLWKPVLGKGVNLKKIVSEYKK